MPADFCTESRPLASFDHAEVVERKVFHVSTAQTPSRIPRPNVSESRRIHLPHRLPRHFSENVFSSGR